MHECCLGVSSRNVNTYYSNIDSKRISLVIVCQASGQTVKSCFSYRHSAREIEILATIITCLTEQNRFF